MGYLHIDNLYKDQTILLFKECYALEKIHGTSAYIRWSAKERKVKLFSGGENNDRFISIFNLDYLHSRFVENFIDMNVTIYGEAYGGRLLGMSDTYGKELKFVGFDVIVEDTWLNVPNAENICKKFDIEFVDYNKVSTDLDSLNSERDKHSIQAVRNGCGEGKAREGVILRPFVEFTFANGKRVIAKYKRDEFRETKTPREINEIEYKILEDAKAIADEWVTEMRLTHVLDKLPKNLNIDNTKLVIDAMLSDIYREAKGEIIESKEVTKSIGSKTALMFKIKLSK